MLAASACVVDALHNVLRCQRMDRRQGLESNRFCSLVQVKQLSAPELPRMLIEFFCWRYSDEEHNSWQPLVLFCSQCCLQASQADALAGFSDITVASDAIVSLRHAGTEYVVANGDLRWAQRPGGLSLWLPGCRLCGLKRLRLLRRRRPRGTPQTRGVGSEGDDCPVRLNGSNNMSSLDGINFQETIFPLLTNTVFVFERGGNDTGTFQAILRMVRSERRWRSTAPSSTRTRASMSVVSTPSASFSPPMSGSKGCASRRRDTIA